MTDGPDLLTSDVVAPWEPPMLGPLCPKARTEPDPCDCGYVGEWEYRIVYAWQSTPGRPRPEWAIRRDRAAGRPTRANDEGHWFLAGWDERCPGCGDIERFDPKCNRVTWFAEEAKVVVLMDAHRRAGAPSRRR